MNDENKIDLSIEMYEDLKETLVKAIKNAKAGGAGNTGLDNIQLEFIEPDEEESDWKKSLEEKGDCLHHIAFEVKGMKDQIASLKETGIECIQKGDYPGGRYAFMDTEKEYMVKFELLEND